MSSLSYCVTVPKYLRISLKQYQNCHSATIGYRSENSETDTADSIFPFRISQAAKLKSSSIGIATHNTVAAVGRN